MSEDVHAFSTDFPAPPIINFIYALSLAPNIYTPLSITLLVGPPSCVITSLFTHASNVIAVVISKLLLSGMLTYLFVPSNSNPLAPIFPVTHAGLPTRVPLLLLLPDVSSAVVPVPSSKCHVLKESSVGGNTLFTVTVISTFTVWAIVSVATNFIMCGPFVYCVVSIMYVYGAIVSLLLNMLSIYNATADTPLSSLAVPLIVISPLIVALFIGDSIVSCGKLSTGGTSADNVMPLAIFESPLMFGTSSATFIAK